MKKRRQIPMSLDLAAKRADEAGNPGHREGKLLLPTGTPTSAPIISARSLLL
jgi:hypothetical protein